MITQCSYASSASFQYIPLNPTTKEIRLIQLHPGQAQDPIRSTLHHVCLPEKPVYETVSYCWGDGSIRSYCLLDGHSISIPISSAAVLRRARSETGPRYLWMDAVCINQNDLKERDQQVALMREIYSSSSVNLVFLDVKSDKALGALELLERFWREANVFTDGFEEIGKIIGKSGVSKEELSREESEAYFAVVFSPWFRRVWVMQEAALAPSNSCYIGEHQMPLVDLLRGFRWREYRYNYSAETTVDGTSVNTALRNILTLWRYVDPQHGPYRLQHGASIADALVFARGLNASQPRDHVYGLLGLIRYAALPESIMSRLQPAYARSVLDIFRDATVAALLEEDGIPDFIFEELFHEEPHDPFTGNGSEVGWPSWVPKWSLARDLEVHPGRLNKWWFDASAKRTAEIAQIDKTTIQARGFRLGQVNGVSSVGFVREWSRIDDGKSIASWLRQVEQMAQQISPLDANALRRAISSSLLAGLNGSGRPLEDNDLAAFEEVQQALFLQSENKESESEANDDLRSSERIREVFERTCNNRRFFVLQDGHMGLGPNIMRPGDVVVILDGCRAPLAFRSVQDRYRVVGECYVHGVMNGEAVREDQRSETFLLL